MENRPRLFIGSSSEGLRVAKVLEELLLPDVQVELWPSAGRPGETIIGALERISGEADFAVLLLTDDDDVVSRRGRRKAPRDNVIFELGLFIGRLGSDRCCVVRDQSVDLKMPTDLGGVIVASYTLNRSRSMRAALQEACGKIRGQIDRERMREKVPPSQLDELMAARRFSQSIEGNWWSIRKGWGEAEPIAFVELTVVRANGMPKINGRVYDTGGKETAAWGSLASCVLPIEGKLYFNFEGHRYFPKAPDPSTVVGQRPALQKYLGFNEYKFSQTESPAGGTGEVSDLNQASDEVRKKLPVMLLRCTPHEAKVMANPDPDPKEIARVVQDRIRRLT